MANQLDFNVQNLFPSPVYIAQRHNQLTELELTRDHKKVDKLIDDGLDKFVGNAGTKNRNIFDKNFNELKLFCEKHINNYVKHIIGAKEQHEVYITQSWINITKQGEYHHIHDHPNSLISGVYYFRTIPNDRIYFHDPNVKLKHTLYLTENVNWNDWNSQSWWVPIEDGTLVLFPSWLIHSVGKNETPIHRKSLAFNTFAKRFTDGSWAGGKQNHVGVAS